MNKDHGKQWSRGLGRTCANNASTEEGRSSMRNNKFILVAQLVFGALGSIAFTSALLNVAIAHEGEEHGMECTETSINAMNADIQSMNDGEAKTTAKKEMQMAEYMMAKKDMKACMSHMQNAMEAMEE